MERSIAGVLAGTLLAVSTLGSLAFGWIPAYVPQPKPEGDWRLLERITYENISIFPVVSASSQDTSTFLTLDDGLASGEVVVREHGAEGLVRDRDARTPVRQYDGGASVNQLVLINRGKRPVLLLAGELVSGGKQDRVVSKDRIVPPGGEPLRLDVFCVERGRWSSGLEFSAAKTMVHPSVREQAAVNQNQSLVWESVRKGSTSPRAAGAPAASISSEAFAAAMANEAPTQSYTKIYRANMVGVSVDAFVDGVQRRFQRATSSLKGERVVGVVVAYGGEVAWSDIFASGDLFDHYWNKLLRSYAIEALARPTLRETPSLDDAREFLRRLDGPERQESEPGVYRWREITAGHLAQIELDALKPKTITLHRLLLHRTN
ncbi:MAG TPA: DUF6569 family protein [Candidatus Dormibacteraeota bacterium]|nr:DUF6569 family protein [Candidatus Dormibacteraeota bacterium]